MVDFIIHTRAYVLSTHVYYVLHFNIAINERRSMDSRDPLKNIKYFDENVKQSSAGLPRDAS